MHTPTPGDPSNGRVIPDGELRGSIYALAAAIGAVLVAAGFLTGDDVQRYLAIVAALVQLVPLVIARLNAPRSRGELHAGRDRA